MRLSTALIAVTFTCALHASELRIRPVLTGNTGDCLLDSQIIATSMDGERSELKLAVKAAKAEYEFSVPDSRGWTLSFRKTGCWSDAQEWQHGESTAMSIRIGQAAIIEGTFENRNAAFTKIQGHVYLQTDHAGDMPSANNASCSISDKRWRCVVPGGVAFDLRLDVAGYASVHYWDLFASADQQREVEPQTLHSGADISGWVQDPNGKPVPNAAIALWPLQGLTNTRAGAQRASFFRKTRTNRRGFFQISGLDEGEYRIVSSVPGISPLVVPELSVQSSESVRLPRPLRHDPLAELEVSLDPPTDVQGRPWLTEVTESTALYPNRPPISTSRRAGNDGRVTAKNLRATLHKIVVRDGAGAIVHRSELDLFGGGYHPAQLTISQIRIRGLVRAGGMPLAADVQLGSASGIVRVSADESGKFETAVPKAGKWSAAVLYPRERAAARIKAGEIDIPEGLAPGEVHEVTLDLPGGRIRGEVVSKSGTRGKSVVHIVRDGRISGQQTTDDDGKFDILGLNEGTYLVDAQNATGTTASPVRLELQEDENIELQLVTDPYVTLTGDVVTPDGRPASGALVRYSQDTDRAWLSCTADVHGRFVAQLNSGTRSVQLLVLTYSYPVPLITTSVPGEPLRIQLRRDGGIVRFGRKPATISGRGVTAPAGALFFPQPLGRFAGGLYVEAGSYVLCLIGGEPDQCRTVLVVAGSDQEVDLRGKKKGNT